MHQRREFYIAVNPARYQENLNFLKLFSKTFSDLISLRIAGYGSAPAACLKATRREGSRRIRIASQAPDGFIEQGCAYQTGLSVSNRAVRIEQGCASTASDDQVAAPSVPR
tara:strand:- start:54080 stop:54412 length:333 start_codon:yes stop_codon:yes gene_type:complete